MLAVAWWELPTVLRELLPLLLFTALLLPRHGDSEVVGHPQCESCDEADQTPQRPLLPAGGLAVLVLVLVDATSRLLVGVL